MLEYSFFHLPVHVAPRHRFELRFTDSKSVVLPLDERGKFAGYGDLSALSPYPLFPMCGGRVDDARLELATSSSSWKYSTN
jgi:hypothetical protein